MSQRLLTTIETTRHAGGLSLFFASYLSLCYMITLSMLVSIPQTLPTDGINLNPSTEQTASIVSDASAAATDIVSRTTPNKDTSLGIEANVASAPSTLLEVPAQPPQPSSTSAPSPVTPTPPTLVEQISKPVLQLLQNQQSLIKKLVGSL